MRWPRPRWLAAPSRASAPARLPRPDELLRRVRQLLAVSRGEFFFGPPPVRLPRHRGAAARGKLRLLRARVPLAFRDELAYWGIAGAPGAVLPCAACAAAGRRAAEGARRGRRARGAKARPARAWRAAGGDGAPRDVVGDPRSGPASKLFACVSVAFVAVTAVGLCLSTMPDIRAEEERVSAGGAARQGTRAGLGRAGGGGSGTGPGGGGQRGPRAGLESRPGGSRARGEGGAPTARWP